MKIINLLDNKFMQQAILESQNANCIKGKVGAVITRDNKVLAKGNNSVPNGIKVCTEKTCIRKKLKLKSGEKQELCYVVHAEQNAILDALKNKVDISNATLYVTKSPCMICAKMLINAGINRIVYMYLYPDKEAFKLLKKAKIKLDIIKDKP